MAQNAIIRARAQLPVLVAASGPRAGVRFLEFFTAQIRNPHTRRAYARAAAEFLAWCESAGVTSLPQVQPMHVAAWIELAGREVSAPSVKQRLAAIRHLFDWLVTGHIVHVNPAASVRGPRHVVRSGKTPVLEPAEARRLLDSIDASTPAGLRDKALIGLMVYSFARVGAALAMRVEDVYTQNRRLWVRLHEKGRQASRHALPSPLEEILAAYIAGAGLAGNPKGPLFRTIGRGTGELTRTSLPQAERARHDPPPRRGGRHQDSDRQSQLPRHRHHGVSQKRRHAREGRGHGQPRQHAHHAALRPPARRDVARRGRADIDLRGKQKGIPNPHCLMLSGFRQKNCEHCQMRSIPHLVDFLRAT